MSVIKKFKFGIFFLVAIFACFLFGCQQNTPVNDISFTLSEGDQIILVVGESFEIDSSITIKPSYATNQNYVVSSFNEDIVQVVDNKLVAIAEGEAKVKVVSLDNEIKQDLMTVVVRKTKTTLSAPKNLIYNAETQLFTFDMVPYAVSYTFKLNGTEYELGNSNSFSMKAHNINIVNDVIYAQVKANAPTYTAALKDSSYANEYKIYQADSVKNLQVKNGILSFSKTLNSLKTNIFINNQPFAENSNQTSFSLRRLDDMFINSIVEISVETTIDENLKANHPSGVVYFNSPKQCLNVNVLDVVDAEINQTTLSWQNVPYCAGYAILIDNKEVAQTKNNFFNLETLETLDDLVVANVPSIIKVIPQINDETINVATTEKVNELKISRLPSTTVTCNDDGLIWNPVANAVAYSFKLTSADVNVDSSTNATSYSFVGGVAGTYHFEIRSVGGFVRGGVYYISSKVATKDFTKQPMVSAVIEGYNLKISNVDTFKCEIKFDQSEYDEDIPGNGGELLYDLSKLTFTPGTRTISLRRRGDSNSIPSDPFIVNFIQYETIDEIIIEDCTAKINRSEINKDADVVLSIKNSQTNEVIEHVIDGTEYAFNTISGEKCLVAGTYSVSLYVKGTGGESFSVRNNLGEEIVCATVGFSVLEAPTATLKSTSEAKIAFSKVYNVSNYDLCSGWGKNIINSCDSSTLELGFELGDGGSESYFIRAKGDGTNFLHSTYSNEVSVTRLAMPVLAYNNQTEVITKQDNNINDLVTGFTFDIDGVVEDYDYLTPKHFTKDTVVTLTTLSVVEKDAIYYLNSLPYVLNLVKIPNVATLEMDNNSNLKIIPVGHDKEYELEVVFGFTDKTETYTSNNGVLVGENGGRLDYSYSNGEYLVEITNGHQALIPDMVEEFTVKVRFIEPSTGSDTLINSEFSDEVTMELARIIETTTFDVNANNQLVVTPTAHSQRYGLTLVVNGSEDLTFVDNGEKLVGKDAQLTYTYDEDGGSYLVDLLDSKFDGVIPAFEDTFTLKVKYAHNLGSSSTDLDSNYSHEETIIVLPKSTLSRDKQSISFTNVKANYTYSNYVLLVNDQYTLELNGADITVNDGYVSFDIGFIYNNVPVEFLQETNKINVITLNNDATSSSIELSKKSEDLLFGRTQTIELFIEKNNSEENNSAMLCFNTYQTDYNKEYFVFIYDDNQDLITTKRFENTTESVIKLKLDDVVGLTTVFTICGYVSTSGSNNGVEMFNSVESNVLELQKAEAVSGLHISESVLTFTTVENAVGYEVYQKTGTGHIKLNQDLVTEGSYNIVANITEDTQLVVKTISVAEGFTNSYYSDPINVKVMTPLAVDIVDGEFKIQLPMQVFSLMTNENCTLTYKIVDENEEEIVLDFANLDESFTIDLMTGTLIIPPSMLLIYNSESLMPEDLTFKIYVAYAETEESYYLNSNLVSKTVYGLFEPTKVQKTTDGDTKVEQITWTPSDKNIINGNEISVGYIFALEYTSEAGVGTYYSDNEGLKYYDELTGTYKSYDNYLTGTNTIFPAGFDSDGDGAIDVEFGAGTYKIYMQAVPIGNQFDCELCRSKFTEPYEFEVLAIVEPTVNKGKLTWQSHEKANKFKVVTYKVFDDGTEELILTDFATTTEYDFTNSAFKNYSGVLKAYVKAVSTRDDLVSSLMSEPIYVYRLPEALNVVVEDGQVIYEANKFFSEASIEFVDVETGTITVVEGSNTIASQQLNQLSISTWKGFTNHSKFNETQMFSLGLGTRELNVLNGREYTVNLRLIGNTSETLGIISSSTKVTVSNLKATKMNPNLTQVKMGVLQFTPSENYVTINKSDEHYPVFTSIVDLNYKFNNVEATEFWKNTAVYKISIIHSRTLTTIHAVDYYSFKYAINEGLLTKDVDYELLEKENGLYALVYYKLSGGESIKFNVYLNNQINLRDHEELSYYEVQESMTNGVNTLTSINQEKTIDLASGGSFTVSLIMMGGDSYLVGETLTAYLNAGVSLSKTFIRYGENLLSSQNGKVAFENLKEKTGNAVFDNPVYKLTVNPINEDDKISVFYLYHSNEEDARKVAQKHDSNFELATYLPVEFDEDFGDLLFFDLSEYIEAATYKVTIQTLAGRGDGEDVDYLLNAQTPTTSYTFYKLTNIDLFCSDGVLEFEQSYIQKDGEEVYYDSYEVEIYHPSFEQAYYLDIDRLSPNVKIDDKNHQVYFTMPDELISEKIEYITYTYEEETWLEMWSTLYILDMENDEYILNVDEVYNEEQTYYTKQNNVNAIPIVAGVDNIYQVRIKAKGAESYVLNGSYPIGALNVTKAYGISNELGEQIRIDNGILKWKVENYENAVKTIIKVAFLDYNSEMKTIFINVNDTNKVIDEGGNYLYHYYEFKDDSYDGIYLTNNVEYVISAYIVSTATDVLNSNYSPEIAAYRLKTIDESTIKVVDGVLTWEEIPEAKEYEITVNSQKFTSPINSLDLGEYKLAVGSYSINIRAIGNNSINGAKLPTAASGFIQLDKVDTSSIKVDGESITWNAVPNATGYRVVLNYKDLNDIDKTYELVVTTNEFSTQGIEMMGHYELLITATGVGESKLFNSETVTFTSSTETPPPVRNVEYDNSQNRIVIDVNNEEFVSSDSLVIVYNMDAFTSQTGKAGIVTVTKTITYRQVGCFEELDKATTRYYLPLSIMAEYTNIYVLVSRQNASSSMRTTLNDINLHLFSYGAGTEANPYRIQTAEQLLNISYFENAHYEFTASINLTGVDINERLKDYNAVIASEFGGTLNGNGFAILGFNINDDEKTDILELEDASNFALFGTLNGATIKNLTIGKQEIQLILSNVFAKQPADVVKLSLIATGANNSTIDNVKVLNYKVELKKQADSSLSSISAESIYLTGLFATSNNTTVKNSSINMFVDVNVNIDPDSNTDIYIGSVAGVDNTSNVIDTEITINITSKSSNKLTYVGGVFGCYVGKTDKTTGINNTKVEVTLENIQLMYMGGLVGFAKNIKITESETTGLYTKNNIGSAIYVGGLVGHAQGSTIQNSGSFMEITASVSNTTNKYFGAIVGWIETYQGISSEIINCYSNVFVANKQETSIVENNIVIGMYARATAVTIEGNYYKENN